jgi:hypothetical protein
VKVFIDWEPGWAKLKLARGVDKLRMTWISRSDVNHSIKKVGTYQSLYQSLPPNSPFSTKS